MINCTCHDAVKIIKKTFDILKTYQVTFKVYPLNLLDKNGIYYVVIHDQRMFENVIYEVNVPKNSYKVVDFESTLDQIKQTQLSEYIIYQEKKEIKKYGHE